MRRRQVADDPSRDLALRQAHLLCQRRKFREAERILREIGRTRPDDPEVSHLLQRIAATHTAAASEGRRLRNIRYYLGMQSAWRRWLCMLVGVAVVGYATVNLAFALRVGFARGFDTVVTTQVWQSRGRRLAGRWVPWTRSVSFDVKFNTPVLLAGLALIIVPIALSRGAAQWEELDDTGWDGRPGW